MDVSNGSRCDGRRLRCDRRALTDHDLLLASSIRFQAPEGGQLDLEQPLARLVDDRAQWTGTAKTQRARRAAPYSAASTLVEHQPYVRSVLCPTSIIYPS